MLHIKFSPETLFMLPLAVALDVVGVILFICLVDDFGLTDIIGITTINIWLIMRGKKTKSTTGKKGAIQNLKGAFTHKWGKIAIPTFAELIPYLGVLPMWTLSVLFNLDDD